MRKTISFVLLTFCLVFTSFTKKSHVELSGHFFINHQILLLYEVFIFNK